MLCKVIFNNLKIGPNSSKVLNEIFGTEFNLDMIPFMFMVNIKKNGIDY